MAVAAVLPVAPGRSRPRWTRRCRRRWRSASASRCWSPPAGWSSPGWARATPSSPWPAARSRSGPTAWSSRCSPARRRCRAPGSWPARAARPRSPPSGPGWPPGRSRTVPELGADRDLVRDALLDLHVLTTTYGVPVAGWTGPWRYVWPRDAAFAAVAFARTGHADDAERVLDFLGRVQPGSGVFQARYLPDGSGVPDDRGTQLDGAGWALWATAGVADALPPERRAAFVARHRPLVRAFRGRGAGRDRPPEWSAARVARLLGGAGASDDPGHGGGPARRPTVRRAAGDDVRRRTGRGPCVGRCGSPERRDRPGLRAPRLPPEARRAGRQRRPGRRVPAAAVRGHRRPGGVRPVRDRRRRPGPARRAGSHPAGRGSVTG